MEAPDFEMMEPCQVLLVPGIRGRSGERAVSLVFDHQAEYPTQWAAISSIADKSGDDPGNVAPLGEGSGGRCWPTTGDELRGADPGEGVGAGRAGAAPG